MGIVTALDIKVKLESMPSASGRVRTELFGFPAQPLPQCSSLVNWEYCDIEERDFLTLVCANEHLSLKKLMYRCEHLDVLLAGAAPPNVLINDGVHHIQDGNHRIAILSLLGFTSFPCRTYNMDDGNHPWQV